MEEGKRRRGRKKRCNGGKMKRIDVTERLKRGDMKRRDEMGDRFN